MRVFALSEPVAVMLKSPMTVRDALASITSLTPAVTLRDAELLLAAALGRERAWLRTHPEGLVGPASESEFLGNIRRRAAGEPLQYVLGVQEFFGLPLHVTPAVLIPRPETEHLVESVLLWAGGHSEPLRIADVGTGSGAIALALATHLPDADITATDISSDALRVASGNACRLGLSRRVRFVMADLLGEGESGCFDIVVSNPPYVPAGEAETMQREVVEHEPHTALFAGVDGFEVYRRLLPAAGQALRSGGLLALEIGFGQRETMERLLAEWRDVRFVDDYAGISRVALAIRSPIADGTAI